MTEDVNHTLTLRDEDGDDDRCEDCEKHIPEDHLEILPDDCHCVRCIDCRELFDEEEIRLGNEQCFECFVSERDKD